MNHKRKRFFGLFGVLGIAALLLGVLFGAAIAAPAPASRVAPVTPVYGNTLLQPAPQGQTGGEGGGATATTTNVNVGIPGWVWIVAVLLAVVIMALIASGNPGGTTIIKD